MNDAWQQIGDVLAANQTIRRLHLATAVSARLYDRHLIAAAADPERVLALTAPVASRVLLFRERPWRACARRADAWSRRC